MSARKPPALCGLLSLLIVLAIAVPVSAGTRTESFDTDPGWTGLRNVDASIGNNYGFSDSSNAAGVPGEAGGTFARTTDVSHYADTNLGGVLTLDDMIQASGKFDVTFAPRCCGDASFNNGIHIGFFDSAGAGVLGFQISESNSGAAFWLNANLRNSGGGGITIHVPLLNGDYSWTTEYDPDVGNGQLTVQVFGAAGLLGTSTVNLPATDRAIGASFNAFGMRSGGIGEASAANQAGVFIDDVSYTTANEFDDPPRVLEVQIGGAEWFGEPFVIPVCTDAQLTALPWTNMTEITVTFDQEVEIGPDDAILQFEHEEGKHTITGPIVIAGPNGGSIAKWTASPPLGGGQLYFQLSDNIVSLDGVSLDGEWEDGVSTISGDGTPGGDFVFTFNVVPGDVNQDGMVGLSELVEIRNRQRTFSSHPNYSRLADLDGDGLIWSADFAAAVSNLGSQLASGPAASLAAPEPTALTLAALGLMGCAVRWRRR